MNIEIAGIGTVHTASIMDGVLRAELEKEIHDTNPEKWIQMGILKKEDILEENGIVEYPESFKIIRQLYVNLCSCTTFITGKKPELQDFLNADFFPEVLVVEWYEAAKKVNKHWWGDDARTEEEEKIKKV